jgi:hypothetical protein
MGAGLIHSISNHPQRMNEGVGWPQPLSCARRFPRVISFSSPPYHPSPPPSEPPLRQRFVLKRRQKRVPLPSFILLVSNPVTGFDIIRIAPAPPQGGLVLTNQALIAWC